MLRLEPRKQRPSTRSSATDGPRRNANTDLRITSHGAQDARQVPRGLIMGLQLDLFGESSDKAKQKARAAGGAEVETLQARIRELEAEVDALRNGAAEPDKPRIPNRHRLPWRW